jgi:hypothetical protein
MFKIIIVLTLLIPLNAIELKGDFQLCSTSRLAPMIDIDADCRRAHDSTKSNQASNIHAVKDLDTLILGRSDYVLNGMGFECWTRVLEVKYKWGVLLGGGKRVQVFDDFVQTTAAECAVMVEFHKCRGHDMNCSGHSINRCSFKQREVVEYGYWSYTHRSFASCGFEPRLVTATHMNGQVVEGSAARSDCRPANLSCLLSNRVVIWDRQLVNSCTLHLITQLTNVTELRNEISSAG